MYSIYSLYCIGKLKRSEHFCDTMVIMLTKFWEIISHNSTDGLFKVRVFTSVRLKYDGTHSDQKFSENELYRPIVWKCPRNAYGTPPHCVEAPFQCMKTPTYRGGWVNFQRISGQNGCHHNWYALYITHWLWLNFIFDHIISL